MKKLAPKKLTLKTETIRLLGDAEARQVVGGWPGVPTATCTSGMYTCASQNRNCVTYQYTQCICTETIPTHPRNGC